jgi:hypothetical protein
MVETGLKPVSTLAFSFMFVNEGIHQPMGNYNACGEYACAKITG